MPRIIPVSFNQGKPESTSKSSTLAEEKDLLPDFLIIPLIFIYTQKDAIVLDAILFD